MDQNLRRLQIEAQSGDSQAMQRYIRALERSLGGGAPSHYYGVFFGALQGHPADDDSLGAALQNGATTMMLDQQILIDTVCEICYNDFEDDENQEFLAGFIRDEDLDPADYLWDNWHGYSDAESLRPIQIAILLATLASVQSDDYTNLYLWASTWAQNKSQSGIYVTTAFPIRDRASARRFVRGDF